jgi:hypothetical protein
MGDMPRFINKMSAVLPEISDNSCYSILLGIANDGEAHSEE